jgi:hypothetical protein
MFLNVQKVLKENDGILPVSQAYQMPEPSFRRQDSVEST